MGVLKRFNWSTIWKTYNRLLTNSIASTDPVLAFLSSAQHFFGPVTDGGLHPIPGEQFTRIGVINRVFYRATGVKKTYKCYSKVQTPSCFCNYFLYFLQNWLSYAQFNFFDSLNGCKRSRWSTCMQNFALLACKLSELCSISFSDGHFLTPHCSVLVVVIRGRVVVI